ncbi:hypothetical protein [Azospirillum largimobile]
MTVTMTVTVTAGAAGMDKPVILWINDGLMAIFFRSMPVEDCRQGFPVMIFVGCANFARRGRNPRGRWRVLPLRAFARQARDRLIGGDLR